MSSQSLKSKRVKGSAPFNHNGPTYKQPPETDKELDEYIPNPEWLKVKSVRVLDEFIDVNEGEKELMKIWNFHILTYRFVSDSQLPWVCKKFLELCGEEVIRKNLFRNLCLHLTNLYDFGLLTVQEVHSFVEGLNSIAQRLENEKREGVNKMGPPEQVANSSKRIVKNGHQVKLQLRLPLSTTSLNCDDGAGPVIAIDFGMTYSRVAMFHDNQVRIIKNSKGEEATLSYVTFNEDGSTVIGQKVTKSSREATFFMLKRIIGLPLTELIQISNGLWPRFVQEEEGPMVEVRGRKLSLEMILSLLFRELKTQAEKFFSMPLVKAVIAIPAQFSDRQKSGTVKAGKLAGFKLCSLLYEPTAAAIAYKREGMRDNVKKLLVFDLGRHVLQLTIVEINHRKGNLEPLDIHEDVHLGSETFDINTRNYCHQALYTKYGFDPFEGKDSNNTNKRYVAKCRLHRLTTQCQKARIELSTQFSVSVNVGLISKGEDLSVQITRELFEQFNAQVFQRIIANVDNALRSAAIGKEEIDDILPVGGSTRIPKIRSILSEYFNGKVLNQSVPPECAVVYGAAIHGAAL